MIGIKVVLCFRAILSVVSKVYRERFEELLTADNYRFSAPKDDYPSAYLLGLLGKPILSPVYEPGPAETTIRSITKLAKYRFFIITIKPMNVDRLSN